VSPSQGVGQIPGHRPARGAGGLQGPPPWGSLLAIKLAGQGAGHGSSLVYGNSRASGSVLHCAVSAPWSGRRCCPSARVSGSERSSGRVSVRPVQGRVSARALLGPRRPVQGRVDARVLSGPQRPVQGRVDARVLSGLRRPIQGRVDARVLSGPRRPIQGRVIPVKSSQVT
jgi:hypothetical protein